MVALCWVAMLLACVGYGAGSVLQSVGANRPGRDGRRANVLEQAPYIIGVGCDALGFVGNAVALQRLPLYLVQAVVSASVGVTALIAWRRGARLGRGGWTALAVLGIGLVLLSISSGSEAAVRLRGMALWWPAISLVVPLIGALVAWRLHGRSAMAAMAVSAGLAFSVVAVSARAFIVPDPWWHALADPLLWTIVVAGGGGLGLFTLALQRGTVTAVTAVNFVVELVVPTVVGLVVLGDAVRSGWWPVAAVGFVFALGGTIRLARFG